MVLVLSSLFQRRRSRDRRDLHPFIALAYANTYGKSLFLQRCFTLLWLKPGFQNLSPSICALHKAGDLSAFPAFEENRKSWMPGEGNHQTRTRISFFPKIHALTESHPPPWHRGTRWHSDLCYSPMKIHFHIALMVTICQQRLLDTIRKTCSTLTCSEGIKWKPIPSPARAHPVRSRLVGWLKSDYSVQKTTLLMD